MRARHAFLLALALLVPLSACISIGGAESGPFFKTELATKPGTLDAGQAAALISQYRASHGLPPVTIDPTLTKIASVHANRMAATDTMSHVLPGEGSFQQRLIAGGFQASMAAENVAAGQPTLTAVLEAWRKSPGHNANLLLPNVSKIGIALALADSSRYKYYWSLVLGERYVPRVGDGGSSGPFIFQNGDTTVQIN
ncbi:MAG TPA: CAP domain-containing protein [Bauldia sp.]